MGGTFKVKLKKPGEDTKYLTSDNSGNLTWGTVGTSFSYDNVTDPPGKWTFTPAGGTATYYLKKVSQPGASDKVQWSGSSSDNNWAFSGSQLSYGGSQPQYLKYIDDNSSPTLVASSTTEICLEQQ